MTALPDGDGAIEFASGPQRLSGQLALPDGPGPFPAMILMHGCAGVGRADRGWAGALVSWGYAAFVVDSFTGRGLREVCTQSRALVGTQRVPDAYGALAILGRHPRIDATRIGLMGFSHGGGTTLGAATRWSRLDARGPLREAGRLAAGGRSGRGHHGVSWGPSRLRPRGPRGHASAERGQWLRVPLAAGEHDRRPAQPGGARRLPEQGRDGGL